MKMDLLRDRKFLVSVTGSLLLHIFFIAIALAVILPGTFEVPQEDLLRFNVKAVETDPLVQSRRTGINPNRRFISKKLFYGGKSAPKDVSIDSMVQRDVEVPRNAQESLPKHLDYADLSVSGQSQLDNLVSRTEEMQLKEKVAPVQKSTTDSDLVVKIMRKAQETDVGRSFEALKKPLEDMRLAGATSVSMDPDEGMPGFTPVAGSFGNADVDRGVGESSGSLLKFEPLDEFLDIEVQTYTDPADAQKYYQIKIFARKGVKSFKVMPKEIVFAVDCSLSISPDRLEKFKRGVRYCLEHLNKEDVFNLISFKEKAEYFSSQSLSPSPEAVKSAERFIMGLESSRRTNVYSAFHEIVKAAPARVPSNVMLLSDGRPTYGIVDSRELINSITKINKGVRPVFAFSGGGKVNRYLLDFIAYRNRGWSQFIKNTSSIDKGMGEFYDKIKDPIFLNLRFQLNGLDDSEVFPKNLPDFYQNAEFVLYGRFDREDRFSMRLLGDVDGKTKELIFSRSLNEAPKGDVQILRGWAFNKIYYLISRLTDVGNDPKILQEIGDLSRRYEIVTPYSPELQKID